MELNREQVIKALECCLVESNCTDCTLHHQYETDCLKYAGVKALALIKEITEENENFKKRLRHLLQSDFIASFDEVNIKTKEYFRDISEADELMDERDRYKRYYFNHCFDELIANKEADTKADTVRKMQTLIEEKADSCDICLINSNKPIDIIYQISKKQLDQIANEMLNSSCNDNLCVSCGEVIPEGRQVCPQCDGKSKESENTNG